MSKFLYSIRYYSKKILSYFTLYGYANASLKVKILMLLLISCGIVLFFSLFLGLNDSYRSFAEPSSIPQKVEGFWHGAISITETILGLVCTSTLIALISQAYTENLRSIKEGHFGYKGHDHIMIINYSDKLPFTLEAFNKRYKRYGETKDVLIMLHNRDDNEELIKKIGMQLFSHLQIYIKTGDLLDYSFYESCSIPQAYCVLALSNQNELNDNLKSDNFQVKIASTLLQCEEFTQILHENVRIKKKPMRVAFEFKGNKESFNIVQNLCRRHNNTPCFLLFDSEWFKNNLMGMSMIDTNHLGLFHQLNNYSKHGIFIVKADQARFKNIMGKSFKEAALRCQDGLLIGVIDVRQSLYRQFYINSDRIKIHRSMELIFIAKNVSDIYTFDDNEYEINICDLTRYDKETATRINAGLTERHNRHILIIGNDSVKDFMAENLDKDSIASIKTIKSGPLNEVRKSVRTMLEQHNYFDTILINMSEEESYALYTELMYSNMFKPYNLSKKVLVMLKNQDSVKSVHAISDYFNLLNEDAFLGEHMGQLCFQPDLMFIYNELVTSEGSEFYLIKNNDELRSKLMTTTMNMRSTLFHKHINYVGIIDENNEIMLGECDINKIISANQLIVISKGLIY